LDAHKRRRIVRPSAAGAAMGIVAPRGAAAADLTLANSGSQSMMTMSFGASILPILPAAAIGVPGRRA
jgi:hypothetical protein